METLKVDTVDELMEVMRRTFVVETNPTPLTTK